MPASNQLDLRFSNRDLARLMIPLIVEQFLAILVGLADSLMVAQVGEAAVSAVSLVDSVNVLLQNLFASLATGGAIIAGQYLGRRQMEQSNRAAQQLLLVMGELSLVITVILYLIRPFVLNVVFGSIEPDVAAYANTYYLIVEASNFFLAIYSGGAALLRVMGNSGVSMRISLIMNLINVVGNAIMVLGLQMGVAGVAIPTLVSKAVAAVMMLVVLRRPQYVIRLEHPFSLHHERIMIRNILYVGVPNGIEGSMFQLGKLLLLAVVAPFGTASVAANAVGSVICSFQCLATQSIGIGSVTVVSRCVGAGDFRMVRAYTRKLLLWGYIAMIFSAVISFVIRYPILQVYNLSADATRYAAHIVLTHGSFGMLLWPTAFQLPNTLRAAGDTRYTMLTSTISMWICRVILGVILARVFSLGVYGIWYAMYVDWVFRSVFIIARYRGHRWEFSALDR